MSKFIVSKSLLTENQFCSRRIMHCPSFYLPSKYGRMTQFLSTHKLLKAKKFAYSKEKLLTKIKFAQSKNLLKKFAHSRNLLTEFARSIEKLHTMKNLAGSDGSTWWLNVLHQANRSTAGAHHSTVSVETAGMCWAGPSCKNICHVERTHGIYWCKCEIALTPCRPLYCCTYQDGVCHTDVMEYTT